MATVVLQSVINPADVASIGNPVDVDVSQFEKLRISLYSGGALGVPQLTLTWTDFTTTLAKSDVIAVPTTEFFTIDVTVKGQALNFALTKSRAITIIGITP